MHGPHCRIRFVVSEILREGMMPIMDPMHNLREICKELTLLEDHLNIPQKRCIDCITKHFLKCEALAEEAASLDQSDSENYHMIADDIRRIMKVVIPGGRFKEGANLCRKIRKSLMPYVVS